MDLKGFFMLIVSSHRNRTLFLFFSLVKFGMQSMTLQIKCQVFLILKVLRILELECSSSKAIVCDTNRLVERWCEVGEFVFVKVSPIGLVFPRVLVSYIVYFATDAGNEAFELPLLHWYEMGQLKL